MAKRDFLVSIDLNKNELLNAKLQNLGVLPTLTTGDTGYFGWYNNTANFWTGSYWKSLEETIATNLNSTIASTYISLTPVTGTLSGTTTTLTGATSSNAGLLTSTLYDRLINAVVKNDYYTPYSLLITNSSANTPVILSATTNSLIGRIGGNFQAISIDNDLAPVFTLDDSVPSSKAVKAWITSATLPSGLTISKLYQPDGTNPFVWTDNGGTLHIDGNIVQSGSSYNVHAQQIYTTGDTIILRDGAVAGLSNGQYAGLVAKLYDGANDGQLVFDNTGTARVGDVGSTQAIATREDTPINNGFAYWSSGDTRFNTRLLTFSDISNINSWTGSTNITTLGTITSGTWNGGIISPAYGGTGINNGNRTLSISGNSGSLNFINASTVLSITGNTGVSGTNTGDVTLGTNSGLSLSGQVLNMGTPDNIDATSINSVTLATHTHKVSGLTTSNLSASAGITNGQLANNSITIGSSNIPLGGTAIVLSGLTAVSATTFTGALVGNATTSSTLFTARNINVNGALTSTGVTFNGSSDVVINVSALAASYLTGTIPASVLSGSSFYLGTTPIALNRPSGAIVLSGITSIDGSAGSVANSITFGGGGGAAGNTSYNGSVARIIDYSTVGAVYSGRTLTINGTSLDLSTDRTWSVGTVTGITGTGLVNGITLSGIVTIGGNITLGGNITGLTNTNLSASAGITNGQLANSSIVIGTTTIPLGTTVSTLSGLTTISATTITGSFVGSLTGNASSATALENARNISIGGDVTSTGSTSFNGTSDITIPVVLQNIVTGGTYTKVTVNAKGLVTSGQTPTTLAGYGITDSYKKYSVTITGNNVTTSFAITHSLNTTDILTFVKEVSTNAKIEVEEIVTDVNTLTLNFNVAPANGKQYRVVVGG